MDDTVGFAEKITLVRTFYDSELLKGTVLKVRISAVQVGAAQVAASSLSV